MDRLYRILRSLLGAGALVSIGYGCHLIHPAIPYIVVGALVLIDLREPPQARQFRRRPKPEGTQQ